MAVPPSHADLSTQHELGGIQISVRLNDERKRPVERFGTCVHARQRYFETGTEAGGLRA
jgi:hypothetical protein